MRGLRVVVVLAVIAAGFIVVLELSGRQPERDAVAVAERELGVDLEASRVDVGDVELFVVQAGPLGGPPVLFLHGFPESWYAWRVPMARLAARGFRVIAPNQRGYAGSDKPSDVEAYGVDRIADDAGALILALGYESAFVAAQDWGGSVAWQLALRHPERVRGLAVIDMPHPRAPQAVQEESDGENSIGWYVIAFQIPWLPERIVRVDNWRLLTRALRSTSRPGAFSDERLELMRSAWDRDGAMGTMMNWYRAAWRFPPPDPAEWRIRAPTLVILAPDDAFIPAEMTRRSLDWLEDGHLVELESGTHWVVEEEPDRIASLLGDFFGRRQVFERRGAFSRRHPSGVPLPAAPGRPSVPPSSG